MSTIIIITPPTDPTVVNRVVETDEGATIQDASGSTVATFNGPNAYDNAIKYLKVMKD